jgi:hypothetical protein
MFDFSDVPTNARYDGMTITLGEWYEMGFYRPFEDDSWRFDAYSDLQYTQLCRKFLNRFYDREVSIITPSRWKRAYLRKLNEIMPKYKLLYERVEQGVNPFQDGRERSKSRDIFSDFPETMLSGNSDYASTGNDREADVIHEGNAANLAVQFARTWNDVDVLILDELEHVLFTGIMVPTVPLW